MKQYQSQQAAKESSTSVMKNSLGLSVLYFTSSFFVTTESRGLETFHTGDTRQFSMFPLSTCPLPLERTRFRAKESPGQEIQMAEFGISPDWQDPVIG
jgi:hypothetical protein